VKFSITETDLRLIIKRVQLDNVQLYDFDNCYPQRMEFLINGSPRAKQCTDEYAKFIRGGGFIDKTFYKTIVNKKGLTADKLLRKNTRDYARLKGFAIHVMYNGLGQKISATPVWFKQFRLPLPDEKTGAITKILHHPEWEARAYGRTFKKELITEYDLYNPNPDVVIQQMINTKGGIENYKGQIFWYSENENDYCLSAIDPVWEDVLCDNETKQFRLANTLNGFMASHILITDEMEPKSKVAFTEGLKKFQGARNAMKILHVEKLLKEQTVDLKKFEIQAGDRLFEYSEKAVKENIRIAFSTPPVLVGDLVAGKQGTAQEMRDAYLSYNAKTYDERLIFEETYTDIFSNWYEPIEKINATGSFGIVNLTFDTGNENITLAEKLGVGGTQAYINLLTSSASAEQKINSMVTLFGIPIEVARANVIGSPLPTETAA